MEYFFCFLWLGIDERNEVDMFGCHGDDLIYAYMWWVEMRR